MLCSQEEIAVAVRDARLADPSSFDEEKTWYRRHTNAHTPEEWGTPEEEWAAHQKVIIERRSREPPEEDVGLGDACPGFWGEGIGEDGDGDY